MSDIPLGTAASDGFAQLLDSLAISLAVTTYQADQLVVIRSDGDALAARVCHLDAPMGLALEGSRLAVGTRTAVCEFRNHPRAGRRIPPLGKHDACFLPRRSQTTGDIRGHEMEWIDRELWIVNTRFSCLCTLDPDYSFVPRWSPPFLTALVPEDRCHLNGMAVDQGRPAYVTALGMADTRHGWRDGSATGGCLLEVESGEPVVTGISMPHSPRCYDDRLWVLESGRGTLATVQGDEARLTEVAGIPGFTRGLDFAGPYAFVGVSQLRSSALFTGIPIAETGRSSGPGIWVVDTRSGETVALLAFQPPIEEVFAVRVLHGMRFVELRNESDDPERLISDSFAIPPDCEGSPADDQDHR